MSTNLQNNTAAPLKTISWIFLALTAVGLAIRLVYICTPSNSGEGADEMIYSLVARSLMSGELPYREIFDHKPIGLYYVFALFFKMFGYNLTAIRLMPFAAIGLTTLLLFQIARKWLPQQHFAALCVVLFMTTCASFGNRGLSSNTEILQMPLFAAWWLVSLNSPESSRRGALLLGTLTGLAAQINYMGGFVLAISTALMLAWPLLAGISRTRVNLFVINGALALGAFVAVGLLILAPLLVARDLPQYFEMQYAFIHGYRYIVERTGVMELLSLIAYSSGFVVALVACIIWSERSFRGRTPAVLKRLAQLATAYALTYLAIYLGPLTCAQHFNLLIVPSTLILLTLLSTASASTLKRFTFLAGMFAALLVAKGAWNAYLWDWSQDFRRPAEISKLTDEIRKHAQPGERVLLLDLPANYYFLADVKPATRFAFRYEMFFSQFMVNIGSSPGQEIIKALNSRPVFVMVCFDVDVAPYRELLEGKLAASYHGYAVPGYDECHDLKAYYLLSSNTAIKRLDVH